MHFKNKITNERSYNTGGSEASSLESDRGRIINSAALRRLQQKTQVFPLERNAAVRSRLTHSLEVQQNGRYIAKKIVDALVQQSRQDLLQYEDKNGQQVDLSECLVTLSEMACLMHDIGNPAFGHFGEAAINDWFKRYLSQHQQFAKSARAALRYGSKESKASDLAVLNQEMELLLDICSFEGNAQAIRVIHTLSRLNLTYSQCATVMKYTRCATTPKSTVAIDKSYLQKKAGYYFSESGFVSELCDKLQIQVGHRHPVTYIMEAADDIAYCLADMEDAVEKGIISVDELTGCLIEEYQNIAAGFGITDDKLLELMSKKLHYANDKASKHMANFDNEFFIWLRVGLLHPLAEHAKARFIDNIGAIYEGSFNASLLEDNSHLHAIVKSLKTVAANKVFSNKEVEQLELQGYKITSSILNEYQRVLDLDADEFNAALSGDHGFAIESRLINRISKKYVAVYRETLVKLSDAEQAEPIFEFYYRCRLIQDFISGMTDQFAYDTYRALTALD
ncbi:MULTISPECIES: dGTPase [unclassified Pseudoalteromonas]|uniref:dGTPase n=1 Tax=unclassified Pseudoalteromonas TaxID=194690 RepID=UPI001F35191D|nr:MULTISPECIES: dGTPase [unclassified Pseudoalteromonas]MCF2827219.1 dGTPase [Pseudoalteromonas sp. OF5H-5]MCF2832845.1 dGTPase [Pseudoalteromonas sp. DL2-H6]MCF2926552.1 dGTPase [Pseudoalteromonas sp. DL2-H1]